MYLKFIGSLFLMVSATTIGFLKAEELSERVKRLKEFKRMVIFLQGELRFHRATLSEAFGNVAERIEEPFSSFLKEVSERLEAKDSGNFETVWGEMTEKLLHKKGVAKEDGQLLEMLRGSLGYLDLAMQTENLNLVILQTEEAIRLAKEQQEVKGKLYQTMGITAGAFLILLII